MHGASALTTASPNNKSGVSGFLINPSCTRKKTIVAAHSPLSREVISVQNARKSRGLKRKMLRMQHFCASQSAVTVHRVNSNKRLQSLRFPSRSDGKCLRKRPTATVRRGHFFMYRFAHLPASSCHIFSVAHPACAPCSRIIFRKYDANIHAVVITARKSATGSAVNTARVLSAGKSAGRR